MSASQTRGVFQFRLDSGKTCEQSSQDGRQNSDNNGHNVDDAIIIESPLAMVMDWRHLSAPEVILNITMRTPGCEKALVTGFLLAEGVIRSKSDIISTQYPYDDNANSIKVTLRNFIDLNDSKRLFTMNSSCGICGKTSLKALELNKPQFEELPISISASDLIKLPEQLNKKQDSFIRTGGCHGAALVNNNGQIEYLAEDVGRHNAVDKVIGKAFPSMFSVDNGLSKSALLVSGRVSFEIMQKAVMANISVVIAIGAPTSLAVDVAQRFDVTLVGFLKSNAFNIYAGRHRITNLDNSKSHDFKDLS